MNLLKANSMISNKDKNLLAISIASSIAVTNVEVQPPWYSITTPCRSIRDNSKTSKGYNRYKNHSYTVASMQAFTSYEAITQNEEFIEDYDLYVPLPAKSVKIKGKIKVITKSTPKIYLD